MDSKLSPLSQPVHITLKLHVLWDTTVCVQKSVISLNADNCMCMYICIYISMHVLPALFVACVDYTYACSYASGVSCMH